MHLLPEKVVVQVFTMNKIPMIIMAAGVSSRMKDSSVPKEISQNLMIWQLSSNLLFHLKSSIQFQGCTYLYVYLLIIYLEN